MKINLNGREYGLHYGFGAIRIVCEKTNYPVEKVIELVTGIGDYTWLDRQTASNDLLLAAIKNYAAINNIEIEFPTFGQIEQFRDELSPELASQIKDGFMSSMLNGKTMAEILGQPIPEKKSPTKKARASTKR